MILEPCSTAQGSGRTPGPVGNDASSSSSSPWSSWQSPWRPWRSGGRPSTISGDRTQVNIKISSHAPAPFYSVFFVLLPCRPCPQSMAVGLTGAHGVSALSAAAVDSRSRSASAPTRTPSTEGGGARATTPRRGSATPSTAEVRPRSLSVSPQSLATYRHFPDSTAQFEIRKGTGSRSRSTQFPAI